MVPLQLRLQNFMSYAELDLDLRGIHSAVLSGANGAGKSTLLDAMTYALWDRARAGGEELIRLGQPEMWVELVFEVAGETYRVWRRRTRKKGAQSQLSFQQLGEDGEFVSLEGTGLRETQARINQVLRMGYETFVNSAFILQGQADHFTTKTPKERKAVLGEILGLQHYDELSTQARERWKAAQARADALEQEQAEVRTLLEAREATEGELLRAREAARSLARLLEQAQERQTRLLAEEAALTAARAEREAAGTARAQALADAQRVSDEAAAHAVQIAAARADVARRAEIEADHAAHQALVVADQAHRVRAEAAHAVERRLAEVRQQERDARHAHQLAMQALENERTALARERHQHQDVVDDRERIERARTQLAEARAAEAAYTGNAQRHRQLEQRRAVVEQAIQRAQVAEEARRRDLESRLARARELAGTEAALSASVAATQAELKELGIAAVEQDRVKEKGFTYRAAVERAETAIEAARGTIRTLNAKLAELAVDLEIHAGGLKTLRLERSHACPLCRTELESSQLEAVQRQYREDVTAQELEIVRLEHEAVAAQQDLLASRARYKELSGILSGREPAQERLGQERQQLAVAQAARAEVEALEAQLADQGALAVPPELAAERDALEGELAALGHDPAAAAVLAARANDLRWAEARGWQLEQAIAALERVDGRLPALEAELAERRDQAEREAVTFTERVEALESELAATGHDPVAMNGTRAELEALAEAPARYAALQQRLLWLEGAQAMQARLEAERAQGELRAKEQELAIAALDRKLDRAPLWERDMAAATVEVERLRQESSRRHEEVGRLEAEIHRLDELGERLASKKQAWQASIDEAQTYKELSEAFGKNGIQALIIENALPELEEEANRLLARITDNRMHVRLATQKEKKTGGAAETLEIYISDEVGTRNYEMYSGGEAFRVNFALRLAMSRLLAQRAGARLQTLVIDEGFGTQDEKGRERLVEAINAVSNEFQRILVITHVRELKDAFNTHIEITKRGGVSEVKLSA